MLNEKLRLLAGCTLLFLLSLIIKRQSARLERTGGKSGLSAPKTVRAARRLERTNVCFSRIERRVIPLFLRLYAARRR